MAPRIPSSSPLSSLQSSEATFRTASPESIPRFQSTRLLPFELESYLKVHLEESLFTQAFRFLLSLVSASAGNHKKKVLIPSPEYLATISTIAIHPRMTTRADGKEQQAQSVLALQFLNTILEIAGPINANFTEAYQFRNFVPIEDDSGGSKDLSLTLIYADSQNVFKCRDDFWAVLGWALNCSCLPDIYQERWEYWKLWFDHVLDVLELDWELRENTDPQESLIWQYLLTTAGGIGNHRRVIRSLFADGTTKSLNEFDQVFSKELKHRQAKEVKKQQVVVNVEEEEYGDWMQDEDSFSEEDDKVIKTEGAERSSKRLRHRTPRAGSRRRAGKATEDDESETNELNDDRKSHGLGPTDSIVIRLRIMELLVAVASQPDLSSDFVDLHDLFTLFVEFTRPLPLPTFQRIVMASKGVKCLKQDTIVSLCEFIMQRIIDSEGHGSKRTTFDPVTRKRFSAEYLPYSASGNNMEMQAKLSLLLESVLRIQLDVVKDQTLLPTVSEALNTGIQKRQSKADEAIMKASKNKKGSEANDEAFSVLSESSMRMTFLVMQAMQKP